MKRHLAATLAATVLAGGLLPPAAAEETPPAIRQETTRSDFEAIRDYIGHWRSEIKKTRGEGRPFRFEYRLAWFDTEQTIARMTIRQVFEDGEEKLWWNGYKGWDPVREETYYHGYSPAGRVSAGKFVLTGDHFITFYTAFDSAGQVVELRDVFTAVKNGGYRNVTWLRPAGAEEWRIVARDLWRRADQSTTDH